MPTNNDRTSAEHERSLGTVSGQIEILCVCTENRTRSVLAAAFLERHAQRLRVDARIHTAGIGVSGAAATETAVRLLRRRGIDVAGHRSRPVDESMIDAADLIVTAEQAHVVWIAGRWPDAFARTFTLPELVGRADVVEPRGAAPFADWLSRVSAGRADAAAYLDSPEIGELADPTGESPPWWELSADEIDGLTGRLAVALDS